MNFDEPLIFAADPFASAALRFGNGDLCNIDQVIAARCYHSIDLTPINGNTSHMVSDTNDLADDAEKTQPPMSALRYETPFELYSQLVQVKQLTQHRPREEEQNIDYLMRLRGSTTPEDAVTFTAFAVVPKMAIWWAYECLRLTADDLTQADRDLMERIANWTAYPDNENRYQTMQMALYAPVRTPTVFLGLAVGWSGGGIAPNDPSPVQPYRAPRAINSAVLSSLARADLNQRSVRLARFIDQSNALFQAFA